MSVITLLTDFGTDDEYVGAMKGVILSGNPQAKIVDITHHIQPQDIWGAAYMIPSYCTFFPAQTVHMVVVDPGVGSDRAILAVACDNQIFLAPDNGVLTSILERNSVDRIVRVENKTYFRPFVSSTFHGRDIFAPVAAHISRGLDITQLGPSIRETVLIDLKSPQADTKGQLKGTVIGLDRFGNIITNIDRAALEQVGLDSDRDRFTVITGSCTLGGPDKAYTDVASNKPVVLFGSRGYLEIAINSGSAARVFKVAAGDSVRIKPGS